MMPVTNINSRSKSRSIVVDTSSSVDRISPAINQEYQSESLNKFRAFKIADKVLPVRSRQSYKVGHKLGEVGIYVAPKTIGVEPGAKIIPYDQDFFDYAKHIILELKKDTKLCNRDNKLCLNRHLNQYYKPDDPLENADAKTLCNRSMENATIAEYITRRVIIFKEAISAKAILINLLLNTGKQEANTHQEFFSRLVIELELENVVDITEYLANLMQKEAQKETARENVKGILNLINEATTKQPDIAQDFFNRSIAKLGREKLADLGVYLKDLMQKEAEKGMPKDNTKLSLLNLVNETITKESNLTQDFFNSLITKLGREKLEELGVDLTDLMQKEAEKGMPKDNAKLSLLNSVNEPITKESNLTHDIITKLGLKKLKKLNKALTEQLEEQITKKTVDDEVIKLIIKEPKIVEDITKELIESNAPTIQLIKQDYNEPIIPNRVTIPFERALNSNTIKRLPKFIQKPAAFFYQLIRLRKPKEENLNAIREVIATEIASNFMKTHDQQLIQGFYRNGTPKIATLATWSKEFKSITDDILKTKLAGGNYARGNYLATETERGLQSIDSIKKLGSSYASAIILGDRDFWGSTLGNKGRIFLPQGSEIFGIDFGHCFPSREKAIYPSLDDDFSFLQPRKKSDIFKNYDIFTDTSLSEKMKGYHIAMKLFLGAEPPPWVVASYGVKFKAEIDKIVPGCAAAVFDQYIEYFTNLADTDENYKGYAESLRHDKDNMLAAANHMQKVFHELENLTVRELDLREGLEKLTSKSSIYSPDGKVRLNHLRVERRDRVKWRIRTPLPGWQNSYYLETENLDKRKLSSVLATLQAFFDQYNSSDKAHRDFIRCDGNKVIIEFKRESFSFMHKLFSELAIIAYKETGHLNLQGAALVDNKENVSSTTQQIMAQPASIRNSLPKIAHAPRQPRVSKTRLTEQVDSYAKEPVVAGQKTSLLRTILNFLGFHVVSSPSSKGQVVSPKQDDSTIRVNRRLTGTSSRVISSPENMDNSGVSDFSPSFSSINNPGSYGLVTKSYPKQNESENPSNDTEGITWEVIDLQNDQPLGNSHHSMGCY